MIEYCCPPAEERLNRYQIWLVRYCGWQPGAWNDLPPESIAIEPALPELLTHQHAANYVRAYNEIKLGAADNLWAVAVRLEVHYAGQLMKAQLVTSGMLEKFDS